MNKSLMVLVVIGFLATGADAVDMRDSTNWEGSYEADVTPDLDGWTIPYPTSDPPDGSVSNGIFSFTDTNGRWAGYRNDGALLPKEVEGFSYEIRVKVDTIEGISAFYNTFASPNATFQFRNNGESDQTGPFARIDIGTIRGDDHNLFYAVDPTEWHTYRLTVYDVPNPGWIGADLYVDDNPVFVDSATNNATGGWYPWDDPAGTAGSANKCCVMDIFPTTPLPAVPTTTSIDYIRWTAAGVFEPLPVAAMPCDFNGDTNCDDLDIDLLAAAVRNSTSDSKFNVDGLGDANIPDDADFDFYITDETMIGTGLGDHDLNMIVNFNDFVKLSNDFGNTGTGWDQGNGNTDDVTNFNDFVRVSNNFDISFVSDGTNVPEPAAIGVLGMLAIVMLRRGCH